MTRLGFCRSVASSTLVLSVVMSFFAPTVAQAAVVSSTSAPGFASAQYISGDNFSMSSNPNVLDSMTIPHAVIVQYGRASAGRDYYRFYHGGVPFTLISTRIRRSPALIR
jgi:hypothetical protein